MAGRCVPMIHVPDVRATVQWYESIGFEVVETYSEGEGEALSFAVMAFGSSQVMFNAGGRPGTRTRRDLDLYLYAENVDGIHARLKNRIDVIEPPHDTFYGQREVIVRDVNGFWVTFGEPTAGEVLMWGVRERNADAVRAALKRAGLTPERLNAALGAASAAHAPDAEIVHMLKAAGAAAPPDVTIDDLRRYAGSYQNEEGRCVGIVLQDGTLLAFPDDAAGVSLLPADPATFKCVERPDATITFEVDGNEVKGLLFTEGALQFRMTRVAKRTLR